MVAVPMYVDHITRSQLLEGQTGLSDLRVRMEQFFQDNRSYTGAALNNCGAAAPALQTYFAFSCNSTGQTYLGTATGKAGTRVSGFVYTITEANGRATTASNAGWGTSTTCWITRKGSC
jgi:type IV pilus assembly protein PilE